VRFSVAVLAGGESKRMGRDKALLPLNERPLIAHVVDRCGSCSDDVFVVTKRPRQLQSLRFRVVVDDFEEQTPLSGIVSALRAAARPYVFVCACDMPFVSPTLIRMLADRAEGFDAAVPRRDGRAEPSHGVWAADASDVVATALQAGERAVYRVLETMHVAWIEEDDWRVVDPDGRSFVNVNTPEDLASAMETA
jgi:molybdenum cofactor guanylyltransferase